jgi:hypothetical protein
MLFAGPKDAIRSIERVLFGVRNRHSGIDYCGGSNRNGLIIVIAIVVVTDSLINCYIVHSGGRNK